MAKVSIGYPVYNEERWARRSLDSLLSQTCADFEVIACDNASTDSTWEIIQNYAALDKRVKPVRQKENVGAVKNFHFALDQADGQYFLWAAGDDWWDARFIETLVSALDNNPDYGAAMCSVTRVFDDGEVKNEISFTGANDITRLSKEDVFRKMVAGEHIHHLVNAIFRTAELKKVAIRPIPPCARGDRVFMSEAALAIRFYTVPQSLYKKTVYRKKRSEKYSATDSGLGSAWTSPKSHTRYTFAMLSRLMTSKLIPLAQKGLALRQWAKMAWGSRGLLLEEAAPRLSGYLARRKEAKG
ncbi:MAG: glycosyltransferase family 2 protein [Nitrospinae bacterium]|nr:glycosyltransferase family 2 protein [Nitrospinota bacterium]